MKNLDTADLRIQAINFLREATRRSKQEGVCVGRASRQNRKAFKLASITNYFKKASEQKNLQRITS